MLEEAKAAPEAEKENASVKRVYQIWRGRNILRHYQKEKVVLDPNASSLLNKWILANFHHSHSKLLFPSSRLPYTSNLVLESVRVTQDSFLSHKLALRCVNISKMGTIKKFFLGGRLIFGPDVRSLVVTLFIIILPVIVFCVFVARHLLHMLPHHSGIAVMVIAVVWTAYDLVILLMTSARDPGIIPRNTRPPEAEDEYAATASHPELGDGQIPGLRLPRTKDVIVNGVAVKIKYCDTCMLYRPPRCSHCSICDNCVEGFDHHCPWVGQCIGKRNYRYFFNFIFSSTILCIYVFAFCWVYIREIMVVDGVSFWKAVCKTPASIVLIAYSFLAVWFVGGLSLFHLYLSSKNQTTYENFRNRYDSKASPYNKGLIQNFKEIFFTKIAPSKNNFRAKVLQDDTSHSVPGCNVGAEVLNPNFDREGGDAEISSQPPWANLSIEAMEGLKGRNSNGCVLDLDVKDCYEDNFVRALHATDPPN